MEGRINRDAGGIGKYMLRQAEGGACCICLFHLWSQMFIGKIM